MEPQITTQQPQSVQNGLFVRIGRRMDTFIGKAFRRRNDVIIGPDGSQVENQNLEEKAAILAEKIYHAYVVGRLNFLAQTDGVSDETTEMRREYWKWAVTEPALESALWTKIISVISNQLVMRPASKSPYDKAFAEWVKDCITRSAGGLRKIGEQIFYHGLVWGNVLVEPKWKLAKSPKWQSMFPYGYFTFKDFVARDPADYRIEIDGFRQIIGIWTQKTNEWFPPSYFIHWANKPIYGNPAGSSTIRSCRRACMLIKMAHTFRGIYLEQFGLPMMKGKYNRSDDHGRKIAEMAIQRARSMGYIMLPDGVDVEAMAIATRGESDYQEAIEDYRKEIFLAQTGSYLYAMEGAVGHAAGNSETHRSTLDLAVWYLSSILEEIINDQLIPWLVLLNTYDVDLPRCSIGGVNDGDLKDSLEIDTGLFNLGLQLDEDELYERYHRSPPSSPDKSIQKLPGADPTAIPSEQGQLPMFSARTIADEQGLQQTASYTCGPVSLNYAIQQFLGQNDDISEGVLASEVGATPSGGSTPADLIRVARQYGLDATGQEKMTLGEIKRLTDDKQIIITPIQSRGTAASRMANQEGHYVAVRHVDADKGIVGYFDPIFGESLQWSPINEFVANWHDRDENGRLFTRFGIILSQRKSSPVDFSADSTVKKKACIMALADEAIASKVAECWPVIGDDDLAEKGLETELHITVLYGCDDEHLASAQAALLMASPFKITFGQLFLLEPDEETEVLAARVYGQQLEDLHHKLSSEMGVISDYETYQPHLTIAYLKKGTGQKYLGDALKNLLLGDVCLVNSLVFSDTQSNKQLIELGAPGLLPAEQNFSVENPVNHEIAIAGADGRKVAQLLRNAKEEGAALLTKLCQKAFKRKMAEGGSGSTLFTDEERLELAEKFTETLSSAALLGQSAVWLRFLRDEDFTNPTQNAEETPFDVFDSAVKPLSPLKAIDYFRNLVPMLKVAPDFDTNMRRVSFTLAQATEKTLLKRVQEAITQALIGGKPDSTPTVQALLDKAGVSSRNPDYASMVFRTNMMDAYTQAYSETMRDPAIQDAYPCWRYDGIDDGRQGEDHAPKFGKYYPNTVSFAEVRGDRPYNCRCAPRPVHWSEWVKLEKQGHRIEDTW